MMTTDEIKNAINSEVESISYSNGEGSIYPGTYKHLNLLCKKVINKEISERRWWRLSGWFRRFRGFNQRKYMDKFDEKISDTIDEKYTELIEFYNKKNNEFNRILDIYKNMELIFLSESGNYTEKRNNLEKIQNKIDTYKQNLFIDERKDKYENNNYIFYKSFHFYLLFFYYGLIISYFIFSNFFKEKKYKNIFLISLILLYISIPFILPYLISLIYNVYIYLLEYKNIKDNVISYPNIIEDKN